MNTPYPQRHAALHERIRAALNPQTDEERAVVDWLADKDIPTLGPLADMAERAVRDGTAGAYERGYHEGLRYRREHGAAP